MNLIKLTKQFNLKQSLLIAVTTFGVLFQSEANSTVQCSKALFMEVPFGALRQEFYHTTNYTREISHSRITNQCNLGTCHFHAWANHLEAQYGRKHGRKIEISADFLTYYSLFIQAKSMMANTNYKTDINLGATPLQSLQFIKRYGLRPESAFPIGPAFKTGEASARAQAMIRNYVARVQLEVQDILDPVRKSKLLERRSKELAKMFDQIFGQFPKTFEYEGKTYTDISFKEAFFPELSEPIVEYTLNAKLKDRFLRTNETTDKTSYEIDPKLVDDLIMSQINMGRSVYLSYQHQVELVDNKTGIMSLTAFNIPARMLPMSQAKRSAFNMDGNGHSVQIVGYEKDPATGKLLKIKIKNSWGTDRGDAGYMHMYSDYLHRFAQKILTTY